MRNRNLAQIKYHDASSDAYLSLFVGVAATYLLSDRDRWLFSLAIWGAVSVAITCGFIGKYRYSRNQSLFSIPKNEKNINVDGEQIFPPLHLKHMSQMSLDNIADENSYYLGFCVKRALAEWLEPNIFAESPLRHSCIIIVPVNVMAELQKLPYEERDKYLADKKEIVMFGRQSTVFRLANKVGFWDSPYEEKINTQVDNEHPYGLPENSFYQATLTSACLTGREIKEIIQQTDNVICKGEDQFFNLSHSNCYTGSVYMLAAAVNLLSRKCDNENISEQMASIRSVLQGSLSHNGGQGVLNNKAVVDEVNEALGAGAKNKYKFKV